LFERTPKKLVILGSAPFAEPRISTSSPCRHSLSRPGGRKVRLLRRTFGLIPATNPSSESRLPVAQALLPVRLTPHLEGSAKHAATQQPPHLLQLAPQKCKVRLLRRTFGLTPTTNPSSESRLPVAQALLPVRLTPHLEGSAKHAATQQRPHLLQLAAQKCRVRLLRRTFGLIPATNPSSEGRVVAAHTLDSL